MRRWRLARWVLSMLLALAGSAASELAAQGPTPPAGAAATASAAAPTPAATAAATAAATPPTPAGTPEAVPSPGAVPSPATQRQPQPAAEPGASPGAAAIAVVDAVAGGLALLTATAARALVLLVLVGIVAAFAYTTYRLLLRFLRTVDQRLPLGTRAHWGGFGGADSGWEITHALALLIAALVLAITTAGLGSALLRSALEWRQVELATATKAGGGAEAGEKGGAAAAGSAAEAEPDRASRGSGAAPGDESAEK